MARYRLPRHVVPYERYELPQDKMVTFEDFRIIKKLLKTKKLTEKQKKAIERLRATYDYVTD